ncbi:SET domain-containing protein 5 [Physcia stellaris]|nr:SET domain-containing protein 5 [Physcia stellaris]
MGVDAGFDMVPRLSKGAVDKQNWQSFIKVIKERYQNDELVELKPNYLEFKAGEHPLLPFEGHKFLRFSSKISGSQAKGVMEYVDTVTTVARVYFGSRVRCWSEAADESGFYNWQEVFTSIKSYEQPDEPEIPTTIAQFVFGTDPIRDLDLPLFEVLPVPEKGRGLVARFDIARGTRILYENPLITTPHLSPIGQMESNIATKLKLLSKTQQRQFLSLHNNFPGKHPFSGVVKTNALPCGPNSLIGGIYPTICLINHSCLPNAHNSWNSDTRCVTIHAIHYIHAGEEITISYDKGGPSDTRQTHLKDAFGFDCNCSVCSLPPLELQNSDARRLQIQHLDQTIGDPNRVMSRPDDCLADCRSLLQVLEEEFHGGAPSARLYYDAFQICITHGDQARASVFAGRGYKSRVICEGEDSPETQKVKNLMENPASHRNFGASTRWRTAKGLVPKGLNADEFERWLWRQGR